LTAETFEQELRTGVKFSHGLSLSDSGWARTTDQSVGRLAFLFAAVNLYFGYPALTSIFPGNRRSALGWRHSNDDDFFCGFAAQRIGRRRRKDETDGVPV
jgi:hypothetical protein